MIFMLGYSFSAEKLYHGKRLSGSGTFSALGLRIRILVFCSKLDPYLETARLRIRFFRRIGSGSGFSLNIQIQIPLNFFF